MKNINRYYKCKISLFEHFFLEDRTIKTEIIPSQNDFAINFDYRLCSSNVEQDEGGNRLRRRRTSSLPSPTIITTLSLSSIDFLPQTTNLPNHLIDSRTISFVQEKS